LWVLSLYFFLGNCKSLPRKKNTEKEERPHYIKYKITTCHQAGHCIVFKK